MKVALAQTQPLTGDLLVNLQDHLRLSEKAASLGCAMIAFLSCLSPAMSLGWPGSLPPRRMILVLLFCST